MSEVIIHGSCSLLARRSARSDPRICHAHNEKACCCPKGNANKSITSVSQLLAVQTSASRLGLKPYLGSTTMPKSFPSEPLKPSASSSPARFCSQVYENSKAADSLSVPVAEGNEDGAYIVLSEQSPKKKDEFTVLLNGWKPPRSLWRAVSVVIIAGQVILRLLTGRVHVRNTLQQLGEVGPRSVGVSLLTASFVGMVFTIQFVREFSKLGLTRSVGGVLALALGRELSPVVTAVILAGRVGSAFAAELGTMQVSEQTDTLRVLRTDPIDYLVTPRVIACAIALPILTLMAFTVGMAASVILANSVYRISANIILDSAVKALQPWDILSSMVKSVVFGGVISIVSCAWGVTTLGGAKGVGESTTSAVVISLVCIFIADFALSWCFFQGAGDTMKAAMG